MSSFLLQSRRGDGAANIPCTNPCISARVRLEGKGGTVGLGCWGPRLPDWCEDCLCRNPWGVGLKCVLPDLAQDWCPLLWEDVEFTRQGSSAGLIPGRASCVPRATVQSGTLQDPG